MFHLRLYLLLVVLTLLVDLRCLVQLFVLRQFVEHLVQRHLPAWHAILVLLHRLIATLQQITQCIPLLSLHPPLFVIFLLVLFFLDHFCVGLQDVGSFLGEACPLGARIRVGDQLNYLRQVVVDESIQFRILFLDFNPFLLKGLSSFLVLYLQLLEWCLVAKGLDIS